MADAAFPALLERWQYRDWRKPRVREEVIRIIDVLETIQKVVHDAEKEFDDWLSELEQTCHELDDVLDKLDNDQSQKVCSFTRSSCLSFQKSPVKEFLNVIAKVDQIYATTHEFNLVVPKPTVARARQDQSTSLTHGQEVFGRERDREYLVTRVVYQQLDLQIVSLVGMGGIGKTALAQLVYNDSRVEACFDLRIWINVSDPFDEIGIAKKIIGSEGKVTNTNLDISQNLMDYISGKRFLLVLDDVRSVDYAKWEFLKKLTNFDNIGKEFHTIQINYLDFLYGSEDIKYI